jgi:glycosyltransferase involved in cell wall biosynthesis
VTASPRPVRVYSLQTTLLGNRTYGELLRRTLGNDPGLDFHAEWNPPPEALRVPGLRRFLWTRNPSAWVRARNLDLYAARYEVGASLLARALAARRVRELRPDVLHFHTQGVALAATGLMRRVPTVISADMTAVQAAALGVPQRYRWTFAANERLEARAFRAAAAVVVLSDWAARSIVEAYGVERKRVHVVPSGVDLQPFAEMASRPADEPLRALFVGGRFAAKGGPALIEAFRRAFANDHDVRLDLVSDEAPSVDDPRIRVHRGVRAYSPEWLRLYARANVFALPTAHDASPHVVLEAMAAGLPVIATPAGAIAEFVDAGRTGMLIPIGDADALAASLRALAGDAALRARLGEAGRLVARERYDAARNARLLARIFGDVAAGAA